MAESVTSRTRRRVTFWVSFFVVLLVLLAILDRVGVVVAQRAAESKLAGYAQFETRPTVRVHGFPFLTQAIRGRYDDIEVSGKDVRLGDISRAKLDVHLRGAHISLSDLAGGHVNQLPVDRVAGTVTLPYDQLAQRSGINGLTITPTGDQLKVSAPLPVPGDGTTTVTAQGQLTVDGDSLHLAVSNVQAGGLQLPQAILDQLGRGLTASIPIPPLPYGLRITGIAVHGDGLAVAGAGTDVVLHAS